MFTFAVQVSSYALQMQFFTWAFFSDPSTEFASTIKHQRIKEAAIYFPQHEAWTCILKQSLPTQPMHAVSIMKEVLD